MRIIAGEFRNKRIESPKGDHTRPTTDRVREALMSSVSSYFGGFEDLRVLDLFAGSGALSLESISRGAAHAYCFDKDMKTCKVIQKNIRGLGVESRVSLTCQDVVNNPPSKGLSCIDLVFLDPPYCFSADTVCDLVLKLIDNGVLSEDCLICYEHAKSDTEKVKSAAAQAGLASVKAKTYGDIAIDYFSCEILMSEKG